MGVKEKIAGQQLGLKRWKARPGEHEPQIIGRIGARMVSAKGH